jgi:hypothetical protein
MYDVLMEHSGRYRQNNPLQSMADLSRKRISSIAVYATWSKLHSALVIQFDLWRDYVFMIHVGQISGHKRSVTGLYIPRQTGKNGPTSLSLYRPSPPMQR